MESLSRNDDTQKTKSKSASTKGKTIAKKRRQDPRARAAFLKAVGNPHAREMWLRARKYSRGADRPDIRDRTGRPRAISGPDEVLFGWLVKQLLCDRILPDRIEDQLHDDLRLVVEQIKSTDFQTRAPSIIERLQAFDCRDKLAVCIFTSIADSRPPRIVTTFADVAASLQGVTWLMKSWIPYGMLTMIMGPPGTGKSAFALAIARSVILGRAFFNGIGGLKEPQRVIWCDTEAANVITSERVKAWGIPPEGLLLPHADIFTLFSIERDTETLRELILKTKAPLVVIDSLRSAHSGDENSSGPVAKVCQLLANLAQETGCAIVVVHHTKKLGEGQAVSMDSARGSNAAIALCRSVIAVNCPDEGSKAVRVEVVKSNLVQKPYPFGFQISSSGVHKCPAPYPRQAVKEKSKLEKAKHLLLQMLKAGPKKEREVEGAATEQSISLKTLNRAKKELGSESVKIGAIWFWTLPSAKDSQKELGKKA